MKAPNRVWITSLASQIGLHRTTILNHIRERGAPADPVLYIHWHIRRLGESLQPTRKRKRSEDHLEKNRRWRNSSIGKEWFRNYRKSQAARRRERQNERRKTDPQYKLRCLLYSRFHKTLRTQNATKHNSILKLIGCSLPALRIHLESQFKNGMSWDNHGDVWHVDHIHPLNSFDLSDRFQAQQAWHYSNLRPLGKFDNISKGAKCGEIQYSLLPLYDEVAA